MRYKNECARRIQRFWRNNKEGLAYAQLRDYSHQLLAQRKERRRFSLLGYRRFMGDYLDVNGKSALGEELAEAAGIGSECFFAYTRMSPILKHALGDFVIFSSRVQLLVQKFGRSSKLNPRFAILVRIWYNLLVPRLSYTVI